MKPAILLLTIALSLIAVGLISHSIIRHLLQVVPVVAAFFLAQRKILWANAFSTAISIFWLTIMIFIWLYLLGIARIINGHFTPAEIILTVIIAIACVGVLVNQGAYKFKGHFFKHLLIFLGALALQVFFMWLSLGEKKF